ncbi:Cytosol aminopeptidase, catalytic domain [Boothiomyces macroporosus]|uniref:Cytosol aminopeptidase, catalytic domain n=1 Tax=Boothiomyces macroporosus TaxID=261099 RepID=A0AAD5Y4K7_9FUNG|nr:Cytosol aminopeptidase, catalytic domain [Boothiomyces macroporosus]
MKISSTNETNFSNYDALVIIGSKPVESANLFTSFASEFQADIALHYELIASASSETVVVISKNAPGKRIVIAPTGPLNRDTDDVRRFGDAAVSALEKCKSAGIKKPLIVVQQPDFKGIYAADFIASQYENYLAVTLLGLLYAVYEPIQVREHFAAIGKEMHFESLTLFGKNELSDKVLSWIHAPEVFIFNIDIGGGDPERMAPLKCAAYIQEAFKDVPNVKVTIIREHETLKKEFPLLHAVARCSLAIPDHYPVVVRLEYKSKVQENVKENVFLVGKGVTYDTGGADIKSDGHMRGMSRDKCGAAVAAGFLKTIGLLSPTDINVTADLGFVRNSSGAGNYVSDEVIKSRAGVRCLIGNTDAEGRMVMADLVCLAKERALSEEYKRIPSRIMTIATLTGHAYFAVGEGYTLSLDNGPARLGKVTKRFTIAGEQFGDPWEESTLRREDFSFIAPGSSSEDVCQANSKPSTETPRGHQFPAAFISVASGIDKHGLDSKDPISYTHIDIAASAELSNSGLSLPTVTGQPLIALSATYAPPK